MGRVGRLICGEGHLAAQSTSSSVVAVGRWLAYPLGLRPLPLFYGESFSSGRGRETDRIRADGGSAGRLALPIASAINQIEPLNTRNYTESLISVCFRAFRG